MKLSRLVVFSFQSSYSDCVDSCMSLFSCFRRIPMRTWFLFLRRLLQNSVWSPLTWYYLVISDIMVTFTGQLTHAGGRGVSQHQNLWHKTSFAWKCIASVTPLICQRVFVFNEMVCFMQCMHVFALQEKRLALQRDVDWQSQPELLTYHLVSASWFKSHSCNLCHFKLIF